jgi:Carboxypeptidase regulatory-like domain
MKTTLWVFYLCLIFAGAALAAPVGAIKGYVKDGTGAVVPNAAITLRSEETNVKQRTVTDGSGFFQFLQLPPGSYEVAAEAMGFRKTVIRQTRVGVDEIISLDVSVEVGQLTESVEVQGGAGVFLDSERISTGSNINPSMLQGLPSGNRRFDDLSLLTPGTSPPAKGTQAGGFSAAGARPGSINSMIDGINNVDRQVGGPVTTYRIADAIREYSVITTAPSAELGREAGGQVNVVTKSGTNQFHGGAFWFLRNDALEARDFFTNKLGGTKRKLRQNQFGGTFGGPVIKDKTFFFYSFERQDLNNPVATTAVVPTAAERASVRDPIAQKLLAYYPLPTDPSAPAGRTNFVGNAPQTNKDNTHLVRVDHAHSSKDRLMGRYMKYSGTTLTGGTLPTTGGTNNKPASQNLVVAEDHIFSPSLLAEVRLGYSRNLINLQPQDLGFNAASIFTGVPGVFDAGKEGITGSGLPNIVIAGGYATLGAATNVPQARTLNTYELFGTVSKTFSRHTIKAGVEGREEQTKRYIDGQLKGGLNFSGFAQFAGTCPACNGQSLLNISNKQAGTSLAHWYRYPWALFVQDDIKVKPNLTLSLGLRYEYPSAVAENLNRGTNFWDGIGPVLVGTNQALDIDTTKIGPASIIYRQSSVTLPRSGTVTDKNNFAPVFGFAYTPRLGPGFLGNNKTVIRGGFRVSYDETYNNVTVNQTINPPWNFTTQQQAGVTQPAAGYGWGSAFDQNIPLVVRTTQAPGSPAVGLLSFNGLDNRAPTAYAYTWNFGVQREIAQKASVDVSYLGSAGHKFGSYVNPNQPSVIIRDPGFRGSQAPNEQFFPFPHFGSVRSAAYQTNSIYNGLIVSGKLRAGRALNLGLSYNFSHSIDNASSYAGSTLDVSQPDNRFRTNLERGNSTNDQRHRFLAYYIFEIPVGRGRRYLGGAHGIVNEILGGWQIGGTVNVFSGQPFTVYASRTTDFSGFNTLLDRPDLPTAGPLQIHRGDTDNFFDPVYFGKVAGNPLCPGYSAASNVRVNSGCAPPGRVGNSPRNGFYGPGLINFDATLSKRFPIGERVGLVYRAEFFNIANHPNFSLVANNVNMSSGSFGQMSASSPYIIGAARVIQMTLRLEF